MNEIIKIIKSLEDSGVLLDGVTETAKREKKNKKADFLDLLTPDLLTPSAASLVQPVISSVVKGISGRGVRRAGRECIVKNF